jgi:hypothetical protein
MKIDFISVNDYRKNKKNSLGNILLEMIFDSFILKRVEKDCAKNIKEIK